MSVTTASAPTREQLIEAIAALRASADTMQQVHDLDSGAAEFFTNIAHRLQDEFFGQEIQIAQLAADGLTNREIGERLFLSHRTIGSHLYRIFPKLGIKSRSELAAALEHLPA